MAVERKFIEDALVKARASKYLEDALSKAGFSDIEIQKTPMLTRITVWVTNPGRVIGRSGETINALTKSISEKFNIENPQISVAEVSNPMLEPRLVARYIANALERGANARRLLHSVLNDVMSNGAMGAEIIATGKLAAKGAKAKQIKVRQGYIPKAGNVVKLAKRSSVAAYPKYGAIGVMVRIVKPGTVFPQQKKKAKRAKAELIIGAGSAQPEQQAQPTSPGAAAQTAAQTTTTAAAPAAGAKQGEQSTNSNTNAHGARQENSNK
ncbi:MAG: 30S ribosomal protein S3 [Candidatus Micrarchaeaceae archaeon]